MATATAFDLAAAVHAVHGTLSAAPEPPISHYAVTTTWGGDLNSTVAVRGHRIPVGQPAPLGADEASSPVELVLGALGTCQEVVLQVHARLLGVAVSSIRVQVEGDLDPRGFFGAAEVPIGFSEVRYTVHLESDADPERLDELVSRAERLCPVTAIIAEPTPVAGAYVVNGVPYQVAVPA